jgi:uracil-DNA glycosylase
MFNVIELFEKANGLFLNFDTEKLGMDKVPEMMHFGFFPGGLGTYDQTESLEGRNILILGQDFGTESYYKKWKPTGESEKLYTWGNLLKLIEETKLDRNSIFFTNAYMGLRKDKIGQNEKKVTMTSPLKAKSNPNFKKACQDFFKIQLNTVKPKVVFVLGKEPALFLAEIFPELQKMSDKIQEVDKNCNQILTIDFNMQKIIFAILTHPSFAHINRKNRRLEYARETHEGKDAEIAIINRSLEMAGIK